MVGRLAFLQEIRGFEPKLLRKINGNEGET
jgi:hypothetical protein